MDREHETNDETHDPFARPEAVELPPMRRGGPPFWEEWRGLVDDEEIEFVKIIFEEFCGSWE